MSGNKLIDLTSAVTYKNKHTAHCMSSTTENKQELRQPTTEGANYSNVFSSNLQTTGNCFPNTATGMTDYY